MRKQEGNSRIEALRVKRAQKRGDARILAGRLRNDHA